MKITPYKHTFKVQFKGIYPNQHDLDELNAKRLGNYWLDTSRGYNRVLVSTGSGHTYCCMECPVNETFKM